MFQPLVSAMFEVPGALPLTVNVPAEFISIQNPIFSSRLVRLAPYGTLGSYFIHKPVVAFQEYTKSYVPAMDASTSTGVVLDGWTLKETRFQPATSVMLWVITGMGVTDGELVLVGVLLGVNEAVGVNVCVLLGV
jgi:hypothetical protein